MMVNKKKPAYAGSSVKIATLTPLIFTLEWVKSQQADREGEV